jgi:lysophospholipase L1-like esterase
MLLLVNVGFAVFIALGLNKSSLPDKEPRVLYWLNRANLLSTMPGEPDEIVFLGDSLTQNFEVAELFQNLKVKNRGINGDTILGVSRRLEQVTSHKPRKIFIEIGINDLLQGHSVRNVLAGYRSIVHHIRQESPATEIYIQSLLPTSWNIYGTNEPVLGRIVKLNTALSALARKNGATYINLYDRFLAKDRLNPDYDSGDGLHLNGQGYLMWKSIVEKQVNE